jgi:hypothetical protein
MFSSLLSPITDVNIQNVDHARTARRSWESWRGIYLENWHLYHQKVKLWKSEEYKHFSKLLFLQQQQYWELPIIGPAQAPFIL